MTKTVQQLADEQGLWALADERSENLKVSDDGKWLLWGVTKDDDDFAAQVGWTDEGLTVMNFWTTIRIMVLPNASLIKVIDAMLKMESDIIDELA